jgi:hypothetical protein
VPERSRVLSRTRFDTRRHHLAKSRTPLVVGFWSAKIQGLHELVISIAQVPRGKNVRTKSKGTYQISSKIKSCLLYLVQKSDHVNEKDRHPWGY